MGSGNQVDSVTVVQGKYYEKIHEKHVSSYGEFGAANIRDNITSTFREALIQLNTPSKSNNMLLVGKVQSGKTSNLELFTALAFDNGFNLVIIYGGYDSTLLSQTTNRFKKTFDIPNDTDYSDDTPVVFSSDDSAQLLTVDDEIIEDFCQISGCLAKLLCIYRLHLKSLTLHNVPKHLPLFLCEIRHIHCCQQSNLVFVHHILKWLNQMIESKIPCRISA